MLGISGLSRLRAQPEESGLFIGQLALYGVEKDCDSTVYSHDIGRIRDVDPDVGEPTTDFGGGAASGYWSIRSEQRNRSVLRTGMAALAEIGRFCPARLRPVIGRQQRGARRMVTLSILQDPSIKSWLGGVEPAWTLLDRASAEALHRPPSPTAGPIRLASDLIFEELQQSSVARNALILLREAAEGPGLKMTATGNLARSVVAQMCEHFMWPGFDKAHAFEFNKIINEPDFLPLLFVRRVAQASKLLHRYRSHLRVTPAGRRMAEEPDRRVLQAVLFQVALWHLDLGYFGLGPHRGWPQCDAGIVLWSLSIAANTWQPRERLTRLCTIPNNGLLENIWDSASHAMEARILRPLHWFGLLEHREAEIAGSRFEKRQLYRKTALFDRFLSFDVTLEGADRLRH